MAQERFGRGTNEDMMEAMTAVCATVARLTHDLPPTRASRDLGTELVRSSTSAGLAFERSREAPTAAARAFWLAVAVKDTNATACGVGRVAALECAAIDGVALAMLARDIEVVLAALVYRLGPDADDTSNETRIPSADELAA